MKILMAGGTGFIGQELGIGLTREGHDVTVISRNPDEYEGMLAFPAQMIAWKPGFELPEDAFHGIDAVINLTGASVAETSWNERGKEILHQSRIDPAKGLLASMSKLASPPSVYIQASATGIYGDRGDQSLGEDAEAGTGFLADLCVKWEEVAKSNCPSQTRCVFMRIPPVLGRAQGILKTLDKVYAPGIVPALGGGKQWFSWIHVQDLVRAFIYALQQESIIGPVNAVAPNPLIFSAFHHQLAAAKGVTPFGRIPSFLVKAIQGKKASLVLASVRALPDVLHTSGFTFAYADAEAALNEIYSGQREDNCLWLETKQWIPQASDEIWSFFSDVHNLEKLTPEWLNFNVLGSSTETLGEGSFIDYRLKLRGLPLKWRSRITSWDLGKTFVDEQVKGPYKVWYHVHSFTPLAGGTLMIDTVQFKLPLKAVGLVGIPFVTSDVNKIFEYRRQKVKHWPSLVKAT